MHPRFDSFFSLYLRFEFFNIIFIQETVVEIAEDDGVTPAAVPDKGASSFQNCSIAHILMILYNSRTQG